MYIGVAGTYASFDLSSGWDAEYYILEKLAPYLAIWGVGEGFVSESMVSVRFVGLSSTAPAPIRASNAT
jgi:hypothetical protein